jgi:FkbM family methyltransferase
MQFARKLYYTLKGVADHPLTRESPVRSVLKFCLAQAAVRWVPGDIVVPFPDKTRLISSPHMKGAAHFISPGLCEFEEMCFAAHFLRSDDTFADVGANVGAYTLLASGVVGAKTVAFEPSPPSFRYLQENVRINSLAERVTVLNAALGAQPGSLPLTQDLGTENYICPNGASTRATRAVEVEVTTLDRAFTDSVPNLMKVDVEGFETEVFAGAQRLLSNPGMEAMIVERGGMGVRYGHDEAALHQRIRASGFVPCSYSALTRTLSTVPPEAQGNIIYLRNIERAQKRLTEARAFTFSGRSI